jgi:hypothetical protein
LAGVLLYAVAANPLFVFCIGASGHRQVETTTCDGCGHPSDAPPLESKPNPSGSFASTTPGECGNCSDFDLLLPACSEERPDRLPAGGPAWEAVECAPPVDASAALRVQFSGHPPDQPAFDSPPLFRLSLRI